ncbi:NUDIX domain-containing protein [Mucilaginibacter corticis]|uniref:NUDIX domain-containing protein n=1 Tax=Mucilaginibacter corticis TaxID=2597670 RepID=A0A556MH31_9SPHI|nr:NUDIX domain-containing protein [Mucilaginibacter corticis]TSJ39163.1 NUDIX domain-containing protein [Mucilaginibacter corticis]
MAQKYRIYINQKVILLTESEPIQTANYQKIDSQTFDLKIIYTWILAHKSELFYVLCKDAKAFLKQVKQSVTVIEAAGGLVKNENRDLLFIYRNDKWDLPKGKIEKGETVKEAAVREVEEECNIVVNKLGKKICKTYHVYIYKDEVVLKKTHWYKMKAKGQNKLKPQKEEGITDVRWFKPNDIDAILSNTFPSILDVLAAMDLITDKPVLLSE